MRISKRRFDRLMRELGLVGRSRRQFVRTTVSDSQHEPAPNVLNCDLKTDVPHQEWGTDLTYLPTNEGWLYLAAIIDLFIGRVVGDALRDYMRVELVLEALHMAVATRRPPRNVLHRSDRGSPYTSRAYPSAFVPRGLALQYEPQRRVLGQRGC